MARFDIDPARINFTIVRRGKEYNLRVLQRASTIFSNLLNLLPSSWLSAIQGPNYTLELKAVAVELAKVELSLEDIFHDTDFNKTRPEFLYSLIGYMIFLNGKLPPLQFDSEEFRSFLLAVLRCLLQGAVPESIEAAVDLLYDKDFDVFEAFILTRLGANGFDISDQFGFDVAIFAGDSFPENMFNVEQSLRLILNIIRPAHTLFKIRYIFTDMFDSSGIVDAVRWKLACYYYDDVRRYWSGVRDRDRLGVKVNQSVSDEDHSDEF